MSHRRRTPCCEIEAYRYLADHGLDVAETAIREADRADKAEVALAQAREAAESWSRMAEQSDRERDAANADAAALAEHLRNAIHDLIGDTSEGDWLMRYEDAAKALAAHEARVK